MRSVAALGVGAVAAVAGAVAAASQSGSPVRAGGIERTDTWGVVFLVLIGLAFLLYVVALLRLRSRTRPLVLVAAVAIAIQLVPLGGPLLLSRDVYSYWAYGRIVATHDRNPFTLAPVNFPTDPATRVATWRRETTVYGPAFTFASAAIAEGARRSAELAALLFRVVAALAGIATTLLAIVVARRKAFAAAFVGWNPLLALSFAGGGHNDAWMVVLLLGALALIARRRELEGGALWILAAAVKAPALLLLPLRLFRSPRGVWIGAALAALVTGVLSTAAFGTAWLSSGSQLAGREAHVSLPSRLQELGFPGGVARGLSYALLAAGALYLARCALRGRPRLALGAGLLVVTSPWVLPWYATWPVALAAVEDDALAQVVALGLALYLLPDRVPL
jgi:alpha-1,6-mannosyltransferase